MSKKGMDQMPGVSQDGQYAVLSPWAETDPIPVKGISPRLATLENKKIGLFDNGKVAASPSLSAVEGRLAERAPSLQFSRYQFIRNLAVAETAEREKFEEWLEDLDAVILSHGD